MSDNGSDSSWSSEQEESLSDQEEWRSYDSFSFESEGGFFINPDQAVSQSTICTIEIAPVNDNVPRKTKALHLQLVELSEALFYIDRPYTAGRYFKTSGATLWQTAVKALLALDIPQKGRMVKEDGIEMCAKKAMGMCFVFVVRLSVEMILNRLSIPQPGSAVDLWISDCDFETMSTTVQGFPAARPGPMCSSLRRWTGLAQAEAGKSFAPTRKRSDDVKVVTLKPAADRRTPVVSRSRTTAQTTECRSSTKSPQIAPEPNFRWATIPGARSQLSGSFKWDNGPLQ
jgi:hypothetical protein